MQSCHCGLFFVHPQVVQVYSALSLKIVKQQLQLDLNLMPLLFIAQKARMEITNGSNVFSALNASPIGKPIMIWRPISAVFVFVVAPKTSRGM